MPDDPDGYEKSDFMKLSDIAQRKFLNDFEDKNLINKIKYSKGKIFQAMKLILIYFNFFVFIL